MPRAFYEDQDFSYLEYWQNRKYEHHSEEIAVRKLLQNLSFSSAVDIGGGFGRMTAIVAQYAAKTTLVEPSEKMRKMAVSYLGKTPIKLIKGSIQDTTVSAQSMDLVTAFRVLHHVPNLRPAFEEFERILKPNGYLLIEYANSLNFKSRVRSLLSGKPILPTPIDLRSAKNIRRKSIDFVNHHPQTILKQLKIAGFTPVKSLSVSNFRWEILKKVLPLKLLLVLESMFQSVLAPLYFGPSIFILARRIDK